MFNQFADILEVSFKVDQDDITPEASLADLELDSLDVVELAMAIEQRLKVRVTEDELIELERVGEIVKVLEDRRTKVA